jgi:hypothetical protein
MIDYTGGTEHDEMARTRELGERQAGAPSGARENVRGGTERGAVALPYGAAQNSGGSLQANEQESGDGPGRGAD